MYQILSLTAGIVIAFMISINGNLAGQYNTFTAAAIIHAVGSIFAILLCAMQKNKTSLWNHHPKWIYLGGAIGVFTTVFQNLAFGAISITSVIALGLFGQTVTSLVIDGLGLFGMKKRPFPRYAVIGLIFSAAGIFMMLDDTITTTVFAVIISFASGISIVMSRTVNACLSDKTGALRGSLVNHLVGLVITVLLALTLEHGAYLLTPLSSNFKLWIYTGGMLGVISVILFNVTVPKVPAFLLTLLVFVGQVFTGIILDLMSGNTYSDKSFLGGLVITAGIVIHMIMERVTSAKNT